MSDLLHDRVPISFIRSVFDTMVKAHWHTFQILTKRAERLSSIAPDLPWSSNIWQGVSLENEKYLSRVDRLREVPASVRFLSIEPMLGPLPNLDLTGISWVIVGGESGAKFRPLKPDWVREIRDRCQASSTPFFFKQWGGRTPKAGGRLLDGREWDEFPEISYKPLPNHC